TFGNEKGIIGIVGSGSNAAYYNGKRVIGNNYGLGYILADEASTYWQARQILRDFLTESMPQGFREKFLQKHNIDRHIILDKSYSTPKTKILLRSFADFILDNRDDAYMEGIIRRGLEKYVKTYLIPLSEH